MGLVPAGFAGCSDEDPVQVPLVLETFEEDCPDALPCGFVRIAGDTESVRRESTFHPGEHALVLTGDGVGVEGAAGVEGVNGGGGFGRGPDLRFDVAMFPEPLGVALVGRCDDPSVDAVEVTLTAIIGPPGDAMIPDATAMATYRGEVALPDRTASRGTGVLALVEMPDPAPPAGSVVRTPETLTLIKRGPGTCEVSLLAVSSLPASL
jgi:hypothetical protein